VLGLNWMSLADCMRNLEITAKEMETEEHAKGDRSKGFSVSFYNGNDNGT